jgi:hypothetical protein
MKLMFAGCTFVVHSDFDIDTGAGISSYRPFSRMEKHHDQFLNDVIIFSMSQPELKTSRIPLKWRTLRASSH